MTRLPRAIRCFADDERCAQLSWWWHLSGRLVPPGMREHLPRWWAWWVAEWMWAITVREPAQVTDGGPWRGPTTAAWVGRFTGPDQEVLPWA